MSDATTAPKGATFKLSVMMFIQFFVWGAWFVTLGPYMNGLGFRGTDIANAYSTAPVAAILSPFFLGIIADRFFPSQVVMGVLHFVGGLLLMLAPSVATPDNAWLFVGVLLAHMVCYMPTLGLSNTVAFHSMTNPEKQFPVVRVWGTIGWIVAGFMVGLIAAKLHPSIHYLVDGLTAELFEAGKAALDDGKPADPRVQATLDATQAARAADPQFFYVAGAAGVLLGLVSFFMPHTPAPSRGKPLNVGAIIGIDSLRLLKQPSFAVFIGASLLLCIPLAAYYSFAPVFAGAAGVADVPIKMTFGQMSEILFMVVMPFFFIRLGVKWMLAIGMLAWVARYALFSLAWVGPGGDQLIWMILGGIVLHGICYDFFFVTGQIYTERTAPKEVRAQAQGFLVLVTQGVGMLIGNQVFGRLVDANTTDGVVDWRTVWALPAGFALLVLIGFVLLFRDRGKPEPTSLGEVAEEVPTEAPA